MPEDWDAFNWALPELLLEAMERAGEAAVRVYDALVADEAQDLMHPSFFDALDLLLKGGMAGGRWLLSVDPSQAVFADQFQSDLYRRLLSDVPTVQLTVNCRNTRQVAAYVNGLSGNGSVAVRGAAGPDVKVVYYRNDQEYLMILRATVNGLVGDSEKGLHAASDVVILTPDRAFLPDAIRETGTFVRPVLDDPNDADAGGIRVCTVHAFKGLEATCVVLVGLSRIDTAEARRLLYVGGSRAKSLLRVLLPVACESQVQACMPGIIQALAETARPRAGEFAM